MEKPRIQQADQYRWLDLTVGTASNIADAFEMAHQRSPGHAALTTIFGDTITYSCHVGDVVVTALYNDAMQTWSVTMQVDDDRIDFFGDFKSAGEALSNAQHLFHSNLGHA